MHPHFRDLLNRSKAERKQLTSRETYINAPCARCEGISLKSLLETNCTRSQGDIHGFAQPGEEVPEAVDLGPFETFRKTVIRHCLLCRLLENLIPWKSSDPTANCFLLPAQSIHRQEPDVSLAMYNGSKMGLPYANLLYVGQRVKNSEGKGGRRPGFYLPIDAPEMTPVPGLYDFTYKTSGVNESLSLLSHHPPDSVLRRHNTYTLCDDASAAVGLDWNVCSKGLAVKEVQWNSVDVASIRRWISFCEQNHQTTCTTRKIEPHMPSIRLIDCERNCRVEYTGVPHLDYICLSYVWGTRPQNISLDGETLVKVPAVIRDAMTFVRSIGQRYLWVDSICIDQSNEQDKKNQIGMMDTIYRCAWATAVALSSPTPSIGLPRVTSSFTGIPQQTFHVQDYTLRTVGPTLQQQINQSIWATRAWTYQEAILSPRCLYFTPHQVYFECNAMQCCEALDETSSPFHKQSQTKSRVEDTQTCACHGRLENIYGTGVFRDPLVEITDSELARKHRLDKYSLVIKGYSKREMSYPSDALNACGAILKRLEECGLEQGFHWGLPMDCFQQALLWSNTHGSLGRNRREGFPSWSWAGWAGEIASCWEGKKFTACKYEPPLRVWIHKDNRRKNILDTFPIHRSEPSSVQARNVPGYDPITEFRQSCYINAWDIPAFDVEKYSENQRAKLLLIHGIICKMNITFETFDQNENAKVNAKVNEVPCTIAFFNPHTQNKLRHDRNPRLLLVHRSHDNFGCFVYHFLAVKWQASRNEEIALTGERYGTVSVRIRELEWGVYRRDAVKRFVGQGQMELKAVILR